MQPMKLRANEASRYVRPTNGSLTRMPFWLRLKPPIRLFITGLTLLFLMLCVSCAAVTPDAPSISRCRVPLAQLDPREEPPLQDQNDRDLLKENDAVREAFRLSERDKQLTKNFILDRCKDSLPPSDSSSQPAAGAARPAE